MTCIRKLTPLDRLILGVRDPETADIVAHQPACRLLVERLKWATLATILIAILGVGIMWSVQARASAHARQQLADTVARDCVDRPGDIAFRNVLADLVKINEQAQQQPPLLSVVEARQATIKALREGLHDAGPVPRCIVDHVP